MNWLVVLLSLQFLAFSRSEPSFEIDYENNQFLKDGKPFRYVSGSVHYFRTHPDQWEDRLKMVRAAGLNAIQTYIPWNFHEPHKRRYMFDGAGDFQKFFEIAQANQLFVLVRPGPYICAEWENGGLPYWLLNYPNMTMRTSNPDYMREALAWWDVLLPMIKPYLYNNGGPVIMTQLENEYGSYSCDKDYRIALRDKAVEILGEKAVLYTTDGPSLVKCGMIENVFTTVDFGSVEELEGDKYFAVQREANKGGPLVNSEYYPGWFVLWGDKVTDVNVGTTAADGNITDLNASFNFYMFHGGTNFGFWNGAENSGPLITSYDYWAPMAENGKPNEKFTTVQSVIKSWPDWDNKPTDPPTLKPAFYKPNIPLTKFGNIFDYSEKIINKTRCLSEATTFEKLEQLSGYVKYSLKSQKSYKTLNGTNIKDFGFVYVGRDFKGRISPYLEAQRVNSVQINSQIGDEITILVENQGRLTYKTANDYKGIIGDLILDNTVYPGDEITSCPIDIEKLPTNIKKTANITSSFVPGDIYYGEFEISEIGDTNIDFTKWGKGVVFINNINVGRYWSSLGPQYSLYVPAPILKNRNQIVIVEFEKIPNNPVCFNSSLSCYIDLLDTAIPY
ncbi:unnamed protein product [Auanema sp. JU1783]|nr:unnamed protein product [Auanema sp. JU1783]